RDAKITKDALKSKKPVFLVLNKCDLSESLPLTEFRALGVAPEKTFYVSATTGKGIGELVDSILSSLRLEFLSTSYTGTRAEPPANAGEPVRSGRNIRVKNSNQNFMLQKKQNPVNSTLIVALIGRPNVGKSSLFNTLGKKQQAIVSSRQGTTRDVNRASVHYKGREIEILDTAGLRRPGKREVGIEKFSAIRTLAAIEEADICCLLVDSTEPHVKLDQTLAGQIIEAGKGIIMVVTKADRLENAEPTNYFGEENIKNRTVADFLLDQLERDFDFLPYAPVILTSAETGANVTQIFELALEIDKARHTEIKTTELNKILAEAVVEHTPAGLKNTRPNPKYLVQTDTCPPWFVLHGHNLGLLHWSWKRFLERKIREKYPMVGTPIMFSFRSDEKDGQKGKK
ncbi:GTP-binding protein, partial [Candidatus Saccharibacteria bacterium]|nr:GTP-binding protein [Candidatus Saccharibacteria bacterium]